MSGETTGKTWILTGSAENFEISAARNFDVIGFKEGRRGQASEFAPGDEVIFYLSGAQAFGGIARVTSEMFEDRTPIWPLGKKRKPEAYPWRVEAEPGIVLAPEDYIGAAPLAGQLEHVAKWPAEHWHLAFQGQLRVIGAADAALLRERIEAAARAKARA